MKLIEMTAAQQVEISSLVPGEFQYFVLKLSMNLFIKKSQNICTLKVHKMFVKLMKILQIVKKSVFKILILNKYYKVKEFLMVQNLHLIIIFFCL